MTSYVMSLFCSRFSAARRLLPLFLVVAGMLAFAPEAFAQADDDTVGTPTRMIDQVLAAGGWMVPILICSLLTLALVVLNSIQLTTKKILPAGAEGAPDGEHARSEGPQRH